MTGTPSDAQTILSSFATAMVSLTSLVLTVTLVAVQLAMGQFSPRIVGALLADRWSQLASGLFGASFVVAVLTLREIHDSGDGTVPGVSVLLSYALMLASIVVLVLYVHHAGQGLRVAGLIDLVGDRTREIIVRTHGDPPATSATDVIAAPEPGNVTRVDRAALVAAARRADCLLELVPVVGDFVVGGAPLLRVHQRPGWAGAGAPGRIGAAELTRHVLLGGERVHTEDLAYGFRKLVDIAVRSVAQPFNDPTTAVQALHRLHDPLRQLAPRPLPGGEHRDEDGVVRLVERVMSWDGYVRLAFDEVRLAGASEPQVTRRICAALDDLRSVAPPHRQEPLERQLRLLEAAVRRTYEDEEDAVAALTPDTEGIGSGADVTVAATQTDGTPHGRTRPPSP
ncbi:putative membrane protein [Motilibacter peucedani]|uniref:Putative membrane protein n=1 Tax=Motilibacter peucedani TaxID=598650 RepID=A0A420XPX2_9ACTN|nr:putative membrane protein [Motilibacter peucedani]